MNHTQSTPEWQPLLTWLTQSVRNYHDKPTSHSGSEWRRTRAFLRRGNSQSTEHYAYPFILPLLPADASPTTRTVALRLAALVAEFDAVPHIDSQETGFRSLGQWCNLISRKLAPGQETLDPRHPDAVASRLVSLHTQNVDEAITTIRRIAALAGNTKDTPPLPVYDLFRIFFRWGNGFTESSQRVRRSVLQNYYSGFSTSASS